MTLLYVDCFSGISGDMLLGALLDAGLSLDTLRAELGKVPVGGYRLEAWQNVSHGIAGTRLDVLVDEQAQPERRLADIQALLDASGLDPWVRSTAAAIFGRLASAEAKIHATSVEAVHFHEVGAVDSIVDVIGAAIGLLALGVERIYASSLPLPGGTIRASHGLLPAPAPATLEILAAVGAPTRPAPVEGELVTPTGAAILAELATFEQPRLRVRRVGYGYGTKDLPWPNAVRLWFGEAWQPAPPRPWWTPATLPAPGERSSAHAHPHAAQASATHTHPQVDSPWPAEAQASDSHAGQSQSIEPTAVERKPLGQATTGNETSSLGLIRDEVVAIEANLDDMTPEALGYAMERLFAAGALDVYFTPIQMKKNRPGTLLGVIAPPDRAAALAGVILQETTTLGVRMQPLARLIAPRRQEAVQTAFGPIRVKLKLLGEDGRVIASPEYDDCARIARLHGLPLADVYRIALLAVDANG
ncbi:MAG: nickel pincer cofactor biosynthesis protein LarC [Chloroflexi bacterium]|nr:nickel pincer cofactor biosynthesis protein LarC [Chloroflexota bacterium]